MAAGARVVERADAAELVPLVRAEIEGAVSPGERIALPTGRTPEPLYRAVVADPRSRALWRRFRYLQLDEFIDPPPGVEPFRAALARQLFDPLDLPEDARGAIRAPGDPAEAARLDALVAAEPLALVLLGLGGNGHIAFIEPGDRTPGYHRVELQPESVAAIVAAHPGQPLPRVRGLTIGIDQVLAARRVLLWVPQREKRAVLERVLAGEEGLPASALVGHAGLTVFRAG